MIEKADTVPTPAAEPSHDQSARPSPDAPVVAPPGMFSDCGDTPCPEPVLPTATPEQSAALTDGVRMRENPAEWAFVRLSKLIEDFEKGLDKDEEVAARIVGLPGDGTMQIDDVGFWGPDFILFLGKNPDGRPVRLIQHYAQINVLLDARKKPEERPARRIGFQLSEMVQKTNPKGAPGSRARGSSKGPEAGA